MTTEELIQLVHSTPLGYLKPDKSGRGYICPNCHSGSGNGEHNRGTGLTTKDGIHYFCWSKNCFPKGADIVDIIGVVYGITDFKEKIKKTAEVYGVVLDEEQRSPKKERKVSPDNSSKIQVKPVEAEADYTSFYKQCSESIAQTEYMRLRGISDETCKRYSIGYCKGWTHPTAEKLFPSNVIIIPTSKSTYVTRNTSKTSEFRYSKVGSSRLFNSQALQTADKPIIITEGEIDALSIAEVGGVAVGLGSTTNADQLVSLLAKVKPSQPLILALDNDGAGEKASNSLEMKLKDLHVEYYKRSLYGNCKDANEALIADREGFKRTVESVNQIKTTAEAAEKEAEKEAYLRLRASDRLRSFVESVKANAENPVYSTGFSKLDSLLDGGLHEGLIVLGALSSLGKTTFALQIADHIAQHGQDVLLFALEMSSNELISKSLSRLTYQEAVLKGIDIKNAKTARGISDGKRYPEYNAQEMALITRSVAMYEQYAKHLYILEGIGNIGVTQIRDTVSKHISLTGNKPLVLVDYLQILAPADVRATDKQNTDKAVLELKRISRDFSLPVVAISSFNRENYKGTVNMASFKESGAIEYSADILIGLQFARSGENNFDLEQAKDKDPREIELKILKNRQGKVGSKAVAQYEYFPMFGYFKEKQL